jgi:hypothetical protein
MDFARAAVEDALKRKKYKVGPTELSKQLGCNQSSLWHCIKGHRKWGVDRWLQTMAALDQVTVYGDSIVIKTPAAKVIRARLQEIESHAVD